MNPPQSTASRPIRQTIGLLTTWISQPNVNQQWAGIVEAARKHDYNLITYVGGTLNAPGDERQANGIFDLASQGRSDGLIIWAGNMLWRNEPGDVAEFIQRYKRLPIVTCEDSVDNTTSLLLGDYEGMRQAILHLIKEHNRCRILYLRGPQNHLGSEERYRAYIGALAEAGIPFDARLVSTIPAHWDSSEAAIRATLKEMGLTAGVDYDAVVGTTSTQAITAMDILQAQGIDIPSQVAIIGFDELPVNLTCSPSLTTVSPSYCDMGRQAVEVLMAVMNEQPVDPVVTHLTHLVIRRSCGCFEKQVLEAALPERPQAKTVPVGGLSALAGQKTTWALAMQQAMMAQSNQPLSGVTTVELEALVEAFLMDVRSHTPSDVFLKQLERLLHTTQVAKQDVNTWQAAISTLRRFALPYADQSTLPGCENLWNQARVIISEAVERSQANRIYHQEKMAAKQRLVAAKLTAAATVEEMMTTLAQSLPGLGISGCYVALADNPSDPAGTARLVLAYTQEQQQPLPPQGQNFASNQIIPDAYFERERAISLLVEPLYYEDNYIGFVIFEVGATDSQIYETLRTQLSSAIHKLQLVEHQMGDRQRTEKALRSEQYLLNTLMDNMTDMIYFKDDQSRFLRVTKAMAERFGAKVPSAMLGKTDFDYFTDEHARPAFEDEQRIMRTGQPMINIAEKEVYTDGRVAWASTSKLPLRDETGKIVGTFGVSRDITESKLTEEALAHERDLLKALTDNVPDHIFFKDRQGHITRSNPAYARDLGFSNPEQVLNKTDFDLLDPQIAKASYEEEMQILQSGVPVIGRVEEATYPSGKTLWLSETKIPIRDSSGEIVGLVGIARDITSLKKTEVQAERRAVQLQTAAEISRAASSILDPDVLIQRTVDLIQERFDLYYVGLFLVDDTGQWTQETGRWAVLRSGTGEAGQKMLAQGHKLEIGDTSMIGWCVAHKQGRIALDVGQDAVRFRNPVLPETRSELALPLIGRGEAIGALTIQSVQPSAFSNEDIAIFQTMADQLANAITNARLYERTQTALKEMEATYKRYIRQGWSNYLQNQSRSGYRQVLDGTQALGNHPLPEVQQAVNDQHTFTTTQEEKLTLVVPIRLRDQAIGAIGLKAGNAARSWSEDEIALVESITEQFALAAENLRLLDETQRRAERERLVTEITSKLRASNDPQAIMQTAMSELRIALHVKETRISLKKANETTSTPGSSQLP